MSPIPELGSINSETFSNLTGRDFYSRSDALRRLAEETRIWVFEQMSPPATVSLETDKDRIKMNFSKAIIIEGYYNQLGKDITKLADGLFGYDDNKKIAKPNIDPNVFGIKYVIDDERKMLSVAGKEGVIDFNFINRDIYPAALCYRNAIMALAISGDKLWKDIKTNGFVFGKFKTRYEWEKPWNVISMGVYVPGSDGALYNDSVSSIKFDQNSPFECNKQRVKSLSPVGIFLDYRSN
jgi:hypothetical protein